ncbi:MAG: ABC transporter permease subunit [Actinomycetia bacterium]|nr:ABC transporter permease subunit [Actinomycetes bacterium]
MTGAKVTVDRDTGGQLTRFTFAATSGQDEPVTRIDFLFPEGFDPADAKVDVTLLEGLKRLSTSFEQSIDPQTGVVSVMFDAPVPPKSNYLIQVRDVMTPIAGGTYELPVQYTVEASGTSSPEVRSVSGLTFKYNTPPREEVISRWLDSQAWVKMWNSVKVLDLFLKPQQFVRAVPLLFAGWLMSLSLVLSAFPISIMGGLGTAFMKMSKVPPVRWLASIYINVIRGTPLFLQIFVVFIGLRTTGLRFPDYLSAVVVLAFNSSAYLAEIFRAGIQSISKGQFEAASSLGMTYWQAMRYVIIPQTVRRVLPTMTSEFILLFKDTALFAAVGIFELMLRSQNFVARSGNLTAYVVAALYYLIITIPLINLVGRLEYKLAQSEHGVTAPTGKRRARGGVGPLSGPDFDATAAKHESR